MDNFENIKNLIYSATIHISDLHHYDRIQQNIHHMHCLTSRKMINTFSRITIPPKTVR